MRVALVRQNFRGLDRLFNLINPLRAKKAQTPRDDIGPDIVLRELLSQPWLVNIEPAAKLGN